MPLSLLVSLACCLSLLLLLSAPRLSSAYDVLVREWDKDDVKKQIYTKIDPTFHCFKLLSIYGQHGCDTPFDGIRGVVRLVDGPDALSRLVANPPKSHITAAVPNTMFNKHSINALRDSMKVAGVVVFAADQLNPAGYSPASPAPQLLPPAHPDFPSFPPSAVLGPAARFNRSFVWNPLGDDMRSEYYPFAMQLLTQGDTANFQYCAAENEAAIADGEQAVYWAEFRNPSYAYSDSLTCLDSGYCNPVGSQSIWTTLFPLSRNESRPFIMATVAIDSQSMFSYSSTGAEAVQSGVIALMAAIDAIGRLLHNNETRGSVLNDFKYNLLFFFSHAESFDHAGSRKFVDDLLHFRCQQYSGQSGSSSSSSSSSSSTEQSDETGSCDDPFKPSLRFLHIARNATGGRVGLSRIDRILEVGQVGLNSSLYLHVERDASSSTKQWGEQIRALLSNESIITLDWAAADTPGIPPSVSEAFLAVNSSLPVLHIADHKREFLDRFYHSDDDYQLLQESEESPSAQSTLCALGTLIARSLYVAAGGNASVVHVIRADCGLVSRLIDCLTNDANCGELRDFFYQSMPSTPNHFPGAFFPTTADNYVWDSSHPFPSSLYVRYFNRSLAAAFANTSSKPSYHDAVDPLLQLSFDDDGTWQVTSGNGSTASSRVWTVSNGIARSGRLYRVEEDVVVYGLLLLGLLLSGGSIAAVWFGRKWMRDNFKSV